MIGDVAPRNNGKRRFFAIGSAVVLAVVGVVVLAAVLSSKGSSSAASNEQMMGKQPTVSTISMFNRDIQLQCSAQLTGMEVQYSCIATDAASGVQESASAYDASGASENAVNNLMVTLAAKQIVAAPADSADATALLTLSDADLAGETEDAADLAEKPLLGSSCKRGSTVVYGRTINFNGCGYMKGLSLRYKADATDVATGISEHASGFKSGKGAVEHAIEALFKTLVARGVLVPAAKDAQGMETLEVLPADMPMDSKAEVDMAEKSSSGNVNVCGRNIYYKAGAYYKFPLSIRFKCDAKDTASGISAGVRGHKKGEAACKEAIEKVMKEVAAKGLPLDPTKNCGAKKVAEGDFNAAGGSITTVTFAAESSEEVEIAQEKGGSKSGDFSAYGRTFHYKVSAGLKGLKLRYKATVTDKASGTVGSASGLKSGKGAVEHATKDCFNKMIKAGIITPPAQKTADGSDFAAPSIDGSVLATLEDGSEDESDWELASAESVDLVAEADVADDAVAVDEAPAEKMFSKKGTSVVYGRTIHWEATGYLKGLSWRYKASARDQASGVTGSHSGNKSGEGAVKDAIADCFNKMKAAGVLNF